MVDFLSFCFLFIQGLISYVFSTDIGNPTAQQAGRPSFMDYFDKQDSNKAQESYNHNQQDPYVIKTAFPDNWKVPQDGDFDFVSAILFILVPFIFDQVNHCGCMCDLAKKPGFRRAAVASQCPGPHDGA